MDNRELDVAIPETRTESLAGGNGLDAEEEDVSKIKDTPEYVTNMCDSTSWAVQSHAYLAS